MGQSSDETSKNHHESNECQSSTEERRSSMLSGRFIQPEILKVDASVERKAKRRKYSIMTGLAFVNFWLAASISVQAPFFPQEAESKGATPTEYGLVFGIYELVVLVSSLVYGKIMSRITPYILIVAGTLLGGVACTIFGVLDKLPPGRGYLAMAFMVRIFEGIGSGAVYTATFTILAINFPTSTATSFSLMEMAFGFGLIVGPTIGGALFQVGGFLLPFLVIGVFLILGSGLLLCVLPKSEGEAVEETKVPIFKFLNDGGIISYFLSITSSIIIIGFNSATLEPKLRKFHLAPWILGFVFVSCGGIYAMTTPLWGLICDKGADPLHIDVIGYCLTCVGIIFIGPIPIIPFEATLWTVILSLVSMGLGISAKLVSSFTGSIQNTQARGFPENLSTYGMVSAFFSVSCSLGGFLGPSLGGMLLDTIGYSRGTVILFSIEFLCLLVLVVYVAIVSDRKSIKKEESETTNDNLSEQPEDQKTNSVNHNTP